MFSLDPMETGLKSEIRNPKEGRNPNPEAPASVVGVVSGEPSPDGWARAVAGFGFRASDFGFRSSDFGFCFCHSDSTENSEESEVLGFDRNNSNPALPCHRLSSPHFTTICVKGKT
jgi:hypothetical protein